MHSRLLATIRTLCTALWMILCFSIPTIAHNGPPFRIITEEKAGPCLVSVWAHANIGTSPFFVILNPLPGGKIPDDLKVEIAVQPQDGRTSEKHYVAVRESKSDEVQYTSDVTLDFEGAWKIRVVLESASAGNGDVSAIVQATPHGFGHWDLLLYALPFLALALLSVGAVVRRRRLASKSLQREAPCS
jgi:hypothetical protein